MRVSEAFVEHVARSDRKLIVTLTRSMGSIADNTSGGSIVYGSSKAAVNMVVRSLAIDLAPRGITCVVVNPGWVRTDMGGANATLEPAEASAGRGVSLRRLGSSSQASSSIILVANFPGKTAAPQEPSGQIRHLPQQTTC